jgi:hypothetical protein
MYYLEKKSLQYIFFQISNNPPKSQRNERGTVGSLREKGGLRAVYKSATG